jgi:membrane-associated phospholipid phosphatase
MESGINLILAIQNLGAWLLPLMEFFSFLGTEDFYMLAFPLIYWTLDASLGLRMALMLLLSSGTNTIFKMALHTPRPYWVSSEVQILAAETSFGLPSGHAQNATSVWGMTGSHLRKKWAWVLVSILIFGISFSRLYLAVHFPIDVIGGFVLGFLLVVGVSRFWEPVSAWSQKVSITKQIGAAFAGSMAMLLVGFFVAWMNRDWTMLAEWEQAAFHAAGEAFDPFSTKTLISSAASLFGLFAGISWFSQYGLYSAEGTPKEKFLRYVVGLVGVILFYIGLKAIFPAGEDFTGIFFRYLRYSLVAFWISGGAPFVFLKLNLLNSSQ